MNNAAAIGSMSHFLSTLSKGFQAKCDKFVNIH